MIVGKGQWFLLTYSVDKELPGLNLIHLGVKEDRYQWPRWLGYYSYSNLNSRILPIAALSLMQYGRALECLIREVFISNPELGPVNVLKVGVSDGFYHIGLRPTDAPNMGIVFPSEV